MTTNTGIFALPTVCGENMCLHPLYLNLKPIGTYMYCERTIQIQLVSR